MSAYLIGLVEVTDPSWLAEYSEKVKVQLANVGAKYHARSTKIESLEGEKPTPMSITIIEFPSVEVAREWYKTDEYQELVQLRSAGAQTDLWLTEGM
jgi:uncharacterized protein (DUF1330 family)